MAVSRKRLHMQQEQHHKSSAPSSGNYDMMFSAGGTCAPDSLMRKVCSTGRMHRLPCFALYVRVSAPSEVGLMIAKCQNGAAKQFSEAVALSDGLKGQK